MQMCFGNFLNGTGAQKNWAHKKFSNIFLMDILSKSYKMIWFTNTLVTRIFLRDKYASPSASNIQYFRTFGGRHEGVSCVAKVLVYSKNVWLWHYSGSDWEKEIQSFLKTRGVKEGGLFKYLLQTMTSRGVSRTQSNITMEVFCENS